VSELEAQAFHESGRR